MKVQKQIEVRLSKKRVIAPVDVVQYDTGVQLVFSVLDFAVPTGTTATIYIQKKSGKFVYQENGITVSGNDITVDLENQALTEYGEVKYQLQLKNGTDVITTFAGVLRVERSLANSGAEASKTVISAFDELTAEQLAEFQTKAEQIVQACIATIPEDYTVMEAKINELANAVKGSLSGAVVYADDVSTVEHSPAVSVHGKNLFDGTLETGIIQDANCSVVDDGSGYYRSISINLHAGTYTLSFGSAVTIVRVVKDSLYTNPFHGEITSFTFTTVSDGLVGFTFRDSVSSTAWTDRTIQLEQGATATDYEPYVDPSTVTVRRCGKNIFNVAAKNQTQNGVTFTVNEDGSVTANGTATKAIFIGLGSLVLKTGEKYRLSGSPTGSGFDTYLLYIHNNTTGADTYDLGEGKVFTGKDGDLGVTIAVYAGNTVNNLIFRPMVVYGEESGNFEPYTGAVYIPTADGTVPGVTSLSPTMTILTDTDGVTVECEYNRDTNKVIDKLVNAITSLGVTV